MARRLAAVLIPVALLIFLAIYTCRREKAVAGLAEPRTVVVAQWGQEKYLIYLPLYVAMERGIFQKHNLDVELTFTGNDDQTFAAVAQGSASFGIGDPIFAAIANQKGLSARVVALIVGEVAIWGVTNNPKVPEISAAAQLAGLRIGTFPAPSTNFTLMNELVASIPEGLARPSIVQAPIGSQIALLEAGSADIAMVLEPAASIAESKGYRVVYSSPRFHGPFAFTGVTTTKATVDQDPELVREFVAALGDALDLCHNHPNDAIAVANSLFKDIDRGVIARAVNRMISEGTVPKSEVVSEEAWRNAISTRVRVGDLASAEGTASAVDNQFSTPEAK